MLCRDADHGTATAVKRETSRRGREQNKQVRHGTFLTTTQKPTLQWPVRIVDKSCQYPFLNGDTMQCGMDDSVHRTNDVNMISQRQCERTSLAGLPTESRVSDCWLYAAPISCQKAASMTMSVEAPIGESSISKPGPPGLQVQAMRVVKIDI